MLLRRFSVAGYKNLKGPIVLDGLGPINLIHGANNVGKSNLLQAMALFFRCLLPQSDELPVVRPQKLPRARFESFAAHPLELFHLDGNGPITLSAIVEIQPEALDAARIKQVFDSQKIDVEQTIEWDGDEAVVQITRFRFGDGKDAAQLIKDAAAHHMINTEETTRLLRFAKFLATNFVVQHGPSDRFALVGVRRDLEEDTIQRDVEDVPLALEMYDCRESRDTFQRNRWNDFVSAMRTFDDVLGPGAFEVTYQRSEEKARLMFDTVTARIPFQLLGTGVQQVAALLGHLLMRNASIVAIEEPELNLRWDLQNRLREALEKLVAGPHRAGGVDQIFLTSHSPAFETGDSFWLMQAGPNGPVVSRRPASELAAVVGSAPQHLGLPEPERTPQAYVTSQHVVRLPEDVADRLGVENGGGVIFVDAEPHGVRILSNDDYLDELGLVDEARDADASS